MKINLPMTMKMFSQKNAAPIIFTQIICRKSDNPIQPFGIRSTTNGLTWTTTRICLHPKGTFGNIRCHWHRCMTCPLHRWLHQRPVHLLMYSLGAAWIKYMAKRQLIKMLLSNGPSTMKKDTRLEAHRLILYPRWRISSMNSACTLRRTL